MSEQDKFNLGDNVEIRVYGGYKEVGGNLIEVSTKDERIILDLGVNLGRLNSIYSWPTFQVDDPYELYYLSIVPNIDGLFTKWKDKYEPGEEFDTNILGVFITHLHLDHMFLLPQINRSIDIYMGETAGIIYRTRKKISRRKKFWVDDGLKIRLFRSYRKIRLGEFTITPIHVDHSIPGAYGFKIETPDGVIGYSGDYRLHGTSLTYEGEESLTWDFIDNLQSEDVSLFITEGTKYEDISLEHERDVEEKILYLLRGTTGAALASFSETDVDRLRTFINAGMKEGWQIFVPLRHFMIIKALSDYDPHLDIPFSHEYIGVYLKAKKMLAWEKDAYDNILDEGFEIMEFPRDVTTDKLRKKILVGWGNFKHELINVGLPENSVAIFSYSEPVDEEAEIELDKVLNWLRIFSVPSYRIHCSGHIYMRDLRNIVEKVSPKHLYVIHSKYPENIKKYLGYQ